MEGYQTEDQQIAVIAKYWKENNRVILAGVLGFCIVIVGSHYFYKYRTQRKEQASNAYQEMLLVAQEADLAQVKVHGEKVIKNYSSSPYAALSAMMLAKIAIDEGDVPAAIARFRWVTSKHKKTPLWHVAKIRLARLLYSAGDGKAALKELDNPSAEYMVMYEELKGDIYASLNEKDKARTAYEKAISAAAINVEMPWLSLKLADVGVADDLSSTSIETKMDKIKEKEKGKSTAAKVKANKSRKKDV